MEIKAFIHKYIRQHASTLLINYGIESTCKQTLLQHHQVDNTKKYLYYLIEEE